LKIAELKERTNLVELILQNHVIRKEGNTYRVNPCPVCGGNDHFTVYPDTDSYYSFSGCCKGGSIYDYLQEVIGLSPEEARERLHELAGEEDTQKRNEKIKGAAPRTPAKAEGEATPDADYTADILKAYHNQTDQDRSYFLERGIANELIDKYKLSVQLTNDGRRAVLPIWSGGKVVSYTARALDGQKSKYKNKTGSAPLFNLDYIHEVTGNEIIIITEGIFDALSVESAGYKAIALGGVEHAKKLMQAIEATPEAKRNIFLTAFDNDEAGRTATAKLPFRALQIPAQYKDLNEWHTSEPGAIAESVREQISAAARPHAVSEYLEKAFITDIEKFKTYKDKKTGFANLDDKMNGLYAGLYVVGGISSLGKTTFVHQLGDQLAEMGDHVLYFSLEQSKLEIVSKSLSRITAKTDYAKAVPAINIRSGYKSDAVINAIRTYYEVSKRVNVIEGNFNTTVTEIREEIERYVSYNKVKPVVIIDYLQIITGVDGRQGDKQRIDNTVTELKRISRDLDLTVFVISSLNRGNYLTPIDFESFKESGGIEYTADVIWGLQLQVIHDDLFNKDKNLKEKREKIREAKAADPRKIELVCLKNRNGRPSFSCNFTYYPQYDLFESED